MQENGRSLHKCQKYFFEQRLIFLKSADRCSENFLYFIFCLLTSKLSHPPWQDIAVCAIYEQKLKELFVYWVPALFVNGTKEEAAIALKTAKLLAGKNVKKA